MTDLIPLPLEGLSLGELGAEVVGPFDRRQVLGALDVLFDREQQTRWQVGDLLAVLIDEDDGDPSRTFQDLAGKRYTQDWLSNSLSVSRNVAPSQRRPDRVLSWGHHEAVQHMDPDEQDRWLADAVLMGMNIGQLKQAIKHATQGQLDTGDATPVRIVAPKTAMVRAVLAANPTAWVLWQPCSGEMRRAER